MNQIRILVVDGEIEICESLEMFFSGFGHDVKSALDGKSALKIVHSFMPHFVILDIMIPDISGI